VASLECRSLRGRPIATHNLCIVGFGNIGRALVRLLQRKRAQLAAQHGIEWRITGVASRRLGWLVSSRGFAPGDLLDGARLARLRSSASKASNVEEWLRQANGDVLFEATSLNRHNGQPATDHIRAALGRGAHAISANKGPVVFAYEELKKLAETKKKAFLFESAVMDGVPIFSLFRETLPAVQVLGFRGVLNATTNMVLAGMERGLDLKQAVAKAQEMGIAESDPTDDLEGWDAAVKVAALTIAVLGTPIKLSEIQRQGITRLSPKQVAAARREGKPFKLVCSARRSGAGVLARVKPEQLPLSDPLAHVNNGSSYVEFELDILPGLGITERDGGLETTAYGMLADLIRATKRMQ